MKAAVVNGLAQTPVYADFDAPTPGEGERLIHVTAAALSPLTKGRASGSHYSSENRFPFIAGVDGVGRLDDGTRVYFIQPRAPYGAFAEQAVAPARQCLPLPDDLDDVTAAAIANPGMSSWAALTERARIKPGETVLINGATGASGRLAVQIAKHLGAKRVVATGRNSAALAALTALGADATLSLLADEADLNASFEREFATGVDIVIDYLWGESARQLMIAATRGAPEAVPIRFIQVGSMSGSELALPSALLRSSAIELMGSGINSVPAPRLFAAIASVLKVTRSSRFQIAAEVAPLSEVERRWTAKSTSRLVFTPGS
jgi:NADPH:quinone reductase-like Zn-dependent oxidoreductase